MKKTLIISNPEDEHTKVVCEKLRHYECEPVLLYPERFGVENGLSMHFQANSSYPSLKLELGQPVFDLLDFPTAWYRRPRAISLAEYDISQEGLDFARDEWKTFIHNSYKLMNRTLWVSHPTILEHAANKPLQLTLAQNIGLTIPKTLITNNPQEAQSFINECLGRVIVKAIGRGWVYNANGEAVTFVLTNRLLPEYLESLDEVKVAPVTFQEEVPKAFELRVNVVGQECLAIKIDSQKSEISQVDWRRYDVSRTPYTPFELPDKIRNKCLYLCKKLGLEFGAIDLICRPDGEFVFLEVNGNGQFLWAEELSGVEVSSALARLLAGITPPLKSINFNTAGEIRNA